MQGNTPAPVSAPTSSSGPTEPAGNNNRHDPYQSHSSTPGQVPATMQQPPPPMSNASIASSSAYSTPGLGPMAPPPSPYMPPRMPMPLQEFCVPEGGTQTHPIVIVIDFEATCEEPKSDDFPSEVIEFPAIAINTANNIAIAEFHEYVRPTLRPTLTPFCTQLTGINQSIVDRAQPFDVVYRKFLDWLGTLQIDADQEADPKKRPDGKGGPVILTHGEWDFGFLFPTQLKHTYGSAAGTPSGEVGVAKKGDSDSNDASSGDLTPTTVASVADDAAQVKRFFEYVINLNTTVDGAYNVTKRDMPPMGTGLQSLAAFLGVPLQGRLHSGLDDTRNIVRIVQSLIENNVDVRQHPVKCFTCGKLGHRSADCPVATCYHCGEHGHLRKDCPLAPMRAPTTHGAPLPGAPRYPRNQFAGAPGGYNRAPMPTPSRRVGDWDCLACGVMNFASRRACFKCGTYRPGAGPEVDPGVGGGMSQPPPPQSDELVQAPPGPTAAGSGSLPPPAYGSVPHGGPATRRQSPEWICPFCGTPNFMDRPNCRRCFAPFANINQPFPFQ